MKQPESTRLARTGQQGKGRVACTFRLTAPCVGSRRASAAPGGYRPSGPRKPGEAIADAFVEKPCLRAQHDAEGLALNARTITPGWLGERLDVGWAIDVLHPLAR